MAVIKIRDKNGVFQSMLSIKGDKGEAGKDGVDGYTPIRGTDYWTDADKAEIKSYVDEGLSNGVSLVDRTTGKKYIVYVDNDKLTMTESEG